MRQPDSLDGQPLTMPFVRAEDHRDSMSGETRRWLLSRACCPADAPAERLLIVLDGNATAPIAAQMAHLRLDRAGVEPVKPCWVVGVGYPGVDFYDLARRSADYLPAWPEAAGLSEGDSGRALAFARYLDEQLVPELEARNGRRFAEVVLHGHSYGGLFTLYKLLVCPGRTDAFFAISPSLWWAQGWVMSHLHLAKQTAIGKTVFLGIGREERGHATDSPERAALHAERKLQARFDALSVQLGALIGPVARLKTEIFPNEDHGSVLYPSLTRAVRWAMRNPLHEPFTGAFLNYSSTRIATPKGSAFILKLCRHFAHKVPAQYSEHEGQVRFLQGQCVMKADAESLSIYMQADVPEKILGMHFIIDDHLKRFARDEALAYTWDATVPETVRPELNALIDGGQA